MVLILKVLKKNKQLIKQRKEKEEQLEAEQQQIATTSRTT